MRVKTQDEATISPQTVFNSIKPGEDLVFLDRLCRHVHVGNFQMSGDTDHWLFLNVSPMVSMLGQHQGTFFREMLSDHELPPHRIVVEILESAINESEDLARAIDYYRKLGCLIAIDDFGAGHSNFDRIWRLRPHIVKLDQTFAVQAYQSRKVRRMLSSLVDLLHEAGSLVLLEGIETEDQALIAVDSGIDFVQGYFFGRPSPKLVNGDGGTAALGERYRNEFASEMASNRVELQRYEIGFERAARRLADGQSYEDACRELLGLPRMSFLYVLDETGRQLDRNIAGKDMFMDRRFQPLVNAQGADWSRKPYFQRAGANPGKTQITRPYLSFATAKLCITLSILLPTIDGSRVYCVDLDCHDND